MEWIAGSKIQGFKLCILFTGSCSLLCLIRQDVMSGGGESDVWPKIPKTVARIFNDIMDIYGACAWKSKWKNRVMK
jgi:hypothetical protein